MNNEWEKEFDEKFPEVIKFTDGDFHRNIANREGVKSFITSLLDSERAKILASIMEIPIGVTPDHKSFILRDAVLAKLTLDKTNGF